jgi:hypothetical protein
MDPHPPGTEAALPFYSGKSRKAGMIGEFEGTFGDPFGSLFAHLNRFKAV